MLIIEESYRGQIPWFCHHSKSYGSFPEQGCVSLFWLRKTGMWRPARVFIRRYRSYFLYIHRKVNMKALVFLALLGAACKTPCRLCFTSCFSFFFSYKVLQITSMNWIPDLLHLCVFSFGFPLCLVPPTMLFQLLQQRILRLSEGTSVPETPFLTRCPWMLDTTSAVDPSSLVSGWCPLLTATNRKYRKAQIGQNFY